MEKLPKILSVSLSTWRKGSGIHTQTDLFKFWEADRVAQIYTRSDLPNTPVCNNFFQISENAIIKSVFTRKHVGKRVENTDAFSSEVQKAVEEEKKLYAKAHVKKSWFLTLAREVVWSLGVWKTKELKRFIREENPDVYFIPIYPVVYMGKLQRYILKKHPKPYVCYLMDDNYSYKACGKNLFAYIHRFWLRNVVKDLAVNCNEMFAMTKTVARETDNLFGTKSLILTKGINYDNLKFKEKEISTPIKMVYTGKLVIGRAESLVAISQALKNINKDGLKMTLDIYSPDVLDDETMAYLNSNGCTFRGVVPKEEVEKIQEDADVVVFVESLEKEFRYAARLSFSTKLTDYFKSGKCIFAIGDRNIAPIEYLRDNDAAIIVNRYKEIEGTLSLLAYNPKLVKEYGKKAFECGKRNHSEEKIKEVFCSTFIKAAKQKYKGKRNG